MIVSKAGLKEVIYTITDINPDALATGNVGAIPVERRMSWVSKRQTTRKEREVDWTGSAFVLGLGWGDYIVKEFVEGEF